MVSSAESEIERRKQLISQGETDTRRWSRMENMEAGWEQRAAVVATYFIHAGAGVLDLGCGAMTLEKHLPPGAHYYPCDLVARDDRTQVCNFNAGEWPEAKAATLITMLGVLEYIYEVPQFLAGLRRYDLPVVFSYHAADNTEGTDRAALGWVNAFSLEVLQGLLVEAGFYVTTCESLDGMQSLIRVVPGSMTLPKTTRVLVLSYNNFNNFGDRLGYHLLNSLLPAQAQVHFHHFTPWDTPPMEHYDLLILGTGNSVFSETLTDELIRQVERVPRVIGIFGTQYRENIDTTRLYHLLDRMEMWFARYEEDLMLYGKGRENVTHLGDWLISFFPMAVWSRNQTLRIDGQTQFEAHYLDRMIQEIQLYRTVISSRMHPLLCAFTSAEQVAYHEEREDGTGRASGKFRSMLLDVFGRHFPEETFFTVDREAVLAYKGKVQRNQAQLSTYLASLLS